MDQVVFILGGNLGDRSALIEDATKSLIFNFGLPSLSSSIFETAAWGGKSDGNYLNQVLVFQSDLSPEEILVLILDIENKLGRLREEKWSDRTMDIDILYFGQQIITSEKLTIPHPYIQERRFVLEPLAEILPDFVHPVLLKTHKVLLELCLDKTEVAILK